LAKQKKREEQIMILFLLFLRGSKNTAIDAIMATNIIFFESALKP
jgi:hypothetical protein